MSRRIHIPRRDFLKGVGAATAVAGLPGCNPPAGEPGKVDHLVLCMMENRSFDHYFGALSFEGRAIDGLTEAMTNPRADGEEVAIMRAIEACVQADPPHGWNPSRVQFDGGTNQGFVRAFQSSHPGDDERVVMSYLDRERLPVFYAMADQYTLCQRWYSALLAPTWPNRLHFHGASSQGQKGNDLPEGTFYSMLTFWDQLDEAGIDWAYYYSDLPMLALFGRFGDRLRRVEEFFTHAAAGTLPQVVMVEPAAGWNDDHPPHHPIRGQLFVGSIHNALAFGPQWERTLFVTTYDEAGGFFDHVAPPTVPDDLAADGFDQLGFRVPALAMGPYVRQGFTSDVQFEHASAVSHVQSMFGFEPLNARNAAAADFSSLIDEERLAAGDAAPPAELPVIELTEEEIELECSDGYRSARFQTGQPELQALVRATAPHLDRTGELPQIARFLIEQALDLGVLRIKSR